MHSHERLLVNLCMDLGSGRVLLTNVLRPLCHRTVIASGVHFIFISSELRERLFSKFSGG